MTQSYSVLAMQKTDDDGAVNLERHLAAPPAIVFTAFSDPSKVKRWLRPDQGVVLDVLEFDFRVGGGYRFAYQGEGQAPMHVQGKFLRIEPPNALAFSWLIEPPDEHAGIESEVRVRITPLGTGSVVRIQHLNLSVPGAPRRHAKGWGGALFQLDRLFKGSPS